MKLYYVNKNAQDTGEHEVHASGCSYMPNEENRLYLGSFDNLTPSILAIFFNITALLAASFAYLAFSVVSISEVSLLKAVSR